VANFWRSPVFVLLDTPIYEKKISAELLTEHFCNPCQGPGIETKLVTLAIGLDDTLVRQVNLPQIPVDEMRMVLKKKKQHQGYLQQEHAESMFLIATFFPPKSQGKTADAAKTGSIPKLKVLVAA